MQGKETPIACPVGEKACQYLDEVIRLRREVKELSELARTDTLTGIFNYRHFIHSLDLEMERSRRSDRSTALIMLDLDLFKRVNDNWGHDAGNIVLKKTADIIRNSTRKLDIACRYGGEEFAIIIPSTSLLIGIQVAERIRNLIANTSFVFDGQTVNISASFGVDIFQGSDDETPESFIKRTDEYLYQAKNQGRNCVCHATDDKLNPDSALNIDERDALFGVFDSSSDRG